MTDDNNQKSFKIFGDEKVTENQEDVEILLDDEMVVSRGTSSKTKESPLQKKSGGFPGPRPFFMILFVFCVLGGAIYVVYDHLNERLNHVEASGAHEVADLSKELDQRMGIFSAQFANQHAEMNLQIENLHKLLKESAASIKRMNTEINANKKAMSEGISALEARLTQVDGHFDTLETEIDGKISGFESRFKKLAETDQNIAEMNREFEVVRTNLDTMGARVEKVSEQLDLLASEKDAQDLTQHMAEMRQTFDQRFEAMQNLMNRQTVALEDEISALEAMMKSFKELTLQNGQREIIEQELR